jgi:hypothetical protein
MTATAEAVVLGECRVGLDPNRPRFSRYACGKPVAGRHEYTRVSWTADIGKGVRPR